MGTESRHGLSPRKRPPGQALQKEHIALNLLVLSVKRGEGVSHTEGVSKDSDITLKSGYFSESFHGLDRSEPPFPMLSTQGILTERVSISVVVMLTREIMKMHPA